MLDITYQVKHFFTYFIKKNEMISVQNIVLRFQA